MIRTRTLRRLGIAVVCAAGLSACGSTASRTTSSSAAKPAQHDQTLNIYVSLPMNGPRRAESLAIIHGINLALRNNAGHVGNYAITPTWGNDASARTHGWNQTRAVSNAQAAAMNPDVVAFIGDLDSGATAVSLPILNQAGIAQITPGSGYPGLTNYVKGVTATDEPQKYYPNRGSRNLLRLIPSDLVQAAAAVDKLHSVNCVHVATASFGGGADAAAYLDAVAQTAKLSYYHMVPVSPPGKSAGPGNDPKAYQAYLEAMRQREVGCFVLAGRPTPAAVAFTKEIHDVLPSATIVGSGGFCSPEWLGHGSDAVPPEVEQYLFCTSALLPRKDWPGARAIMPSGKAARGPVPARYAVVYGYQAAEMVITAVHNLDEREDSRREVLQALTVTAGATQISSVAGSFEFNVLGDIDSNRYALYTFKGGKLVYDKTLKLPYRLYGTGSSGG